MNLYRIIINSWLGLSLYMLELKLINFVNLHIHADSVKILKIFQILKAD